MITDSVNVPSPMRIESPAEAAEMARAIVAHGAPGSTHVFVPPPSSPAAATKRTACARADEVMEALNIVPMIAPMPRMRRGYLLIMTPSGWYQGGPIRQYSSLP